MRVVMAGLVALVAVQPLAGQFADAALRRSDMVVVADGKFTYTESGTFTVAPEERDPVDLPYLVQVEAPASGLITRDAFLWLASQVPLAVYGELIQRSGAPASGFLDGIRRDVSVLPSGNPLIRVVITLTAEGMVFDASILGISERHSQTWEQTSAGSKLVLPPLNFGPQPTR
jgi:hypothetical protein